MFHSPRIPVPSRPKLEEREDSTKSDLMKAIVQSTSVDYSQHNFYQVQQTARALKNAANVYEEASRHLSTWLLDHGHTEEARQVRKERHKLIYNETKESLDDLNQFISKSNYDTISELDKCSVYSSQQATDLDEFCGLSIETQRINTLTTQTTNQTPPQPSSVSMTPSLYTVNETESLLLPKINSTCQQSNILQSDHTEVKQMSHNNIEHFSPDQQTEPQFMPEIKSIWQAPSALPQPVNSMNQQTQIGTPAATGSQQFSKTPPKSILIGNSRLNHTPHVTFANPSEQFIRGIPQQSQFQQRDTGVRYSSFSPLTSHSNNERLDPHTRHMMKQELLKGCGLKFCGDPQHFISWKSSLQRRIDDCEADSLDIINILLANTGDRPREMIHSFITAGISDPDTTLQDIWNNLQSRFASSERISEALIGKLDNIGKIRNDNNICKLEDLLDLCKIILNTMSSCSELTVFNLRHGMKTIWEKLPDSFQSKWRARYLRHEEETGSAPDFQLFIVFLEKYVKEMSHPSFSTMSKPTTQNLRNVRSFITSSDNASSKPMCLYHDKVGHSTSNCRTFIKLSYNERREFAYQKKLCFLCLDSHYSNKCINKSNLKCDTCGRQHCTAMHNDQYQPKTNFKADNNYMDSSNPESEIRNACTQLCYSSDKVKLCSKTLLVDVTVEGSGKSMRCLCVLDEQSNASYCDPGFIKYFDLKNIQADYSLSTMTNKMKISGSLVSNLMIKGVNCKKWFNLPTLFTHPNLPNTKDEIASRKIVLAHPHIQHLAHNFPPIDDSAQVMLLIGVNCGELMETKVYGSHYPFVHKTVIGYSLVGPACIQNNDQNPNKDNNTFKALRTNIEFDSTESVTANMLFAPKGAEFNMIKASPFVTRHDDDLPGPSQEDLKFMHVLEEGITVNKKGNLQLPLPLKDNFNLPDNKYPVFYRTKNTLERLKRNTVKLESCIEVFNSYLQAGHVLQVDTPDNAPPHLTNYIPIFPVFNENKKVRLVFDSSAEFEGHSLNQALMQGPDHNNSLLGVLIRFRLGEVAVTADVEKMFHAFYVEPQHTDLLRFFWFRNNDPTKDIVPFKALVHIFGNKPSPAVANFALRHTTLHVDTDTHPGVSSLINENFYVDDVLFSADTVEDAISVVKGTCSLLSKFNIRLHKITSTHDEVLNAFPPTELSKLSDTLNITSNAECKTLGVKWSPKRDVLTICPHVPERSFTKRGILGAVNSIFDPLGIASPVVLTGRLLQREIIPPKSEQTSEQNGLGWDDPLPQKFCDAWNRWQISFKDAITLEVPRCYKTNGFGAATQIELHCFSDASDDAIGFVIYLKQVNISEEVSVSFVYGNSKVAPRAANTIPRLELCAAMEAARATCRISEELNLPITAKHFYTDSKIVLGYLMNSTKRFTRYVARRVDEVLKYSSSSQWHHIAGKDNVGDIASRPQTTKSLIESDWLQGPSFLRESIILNLPNQDITTEASNLPEFKCNKTICTAQPQTNDVLDKICSLTNSYFKARSILALVLKFIHLCKGCSVVQNSCDICSLKLDKPSVHFIKFAQIEFETERIAISENTLPHNNPLSCLSPFIDSSGVIRVGGRLRDSNFPADVKHPILLPANNVVTVMIIRECHENVKHQGRHITIGSLRQSGFHILKCSSVVKKFINSCVICRKLRGKFQEQIMADLPPDRLEEVPPFTNVGLDLFGPYLVHDGQSTRRQNATKKVWGLIVTCLVSRAVHLEMLPYLDTSSLQLGLRRFYAIRGVCKRIRSDQGSNIIGARSQIINMDQLKNDAKAHGVTWELIPPAASSWGGVWERKVGAIKKVLDSILLQCSKSSLSRDELATFLQECASIVNNTPLWECSSHPDDPAPLTPANILTLRDCPNPAPPESFTQQDLLSYGKTRWRRIGYLSDQFWIRWRQHHIQSLQKKNKWKRPNTSINIGDIVLVKGSSKRNYWPMGRVTSVKKGRDGLVRSVVLNIPGNFGNTERYLERCVRDTILLVPASQSF